MEISKKNSYILQREEILTSILKKRETLDLSFLLWLVPEERTYTFVREHSHRIIKNILNTDCYIPPKIFTPKRLAKYICSPRRVLPEFAITRIVQAISGRDSTGYTVMLRDFMRELKMSMPNKSLTEIKETILKLINKLLIPKRTSAEILKAFDIFDKYQNILKEKDWLDPEDALILASKLNYKVETLVIEGFIEPYPAEELLINNLKENAKEIFSVFYDSTGIINGNLLPLKDMEMEVEEIAKRIKLKLLNEKPANRELYKYVVAIAGINKYLPKIIRIFNKYGIPMQLYYQKPPEMVFPWNELLYLIETVTENFSRLKFLSFLYSETMTNIPHSIKESVSKISLSLPEINSKEEWFDIELIEDEKIRRNIEKAIQMLEPLHKIKEKATIKEYSTVLKDVLKKTGFENYLKLSKKTKEIRIYNKLFEYLLFIDEILKPEYNKTNLSIFKEIIKDLIGYLYREKEICGVRIIDIKELSGIETQTLFICGVTDEVLPTKNRSIQLLPENLKRELGMRDFEKDIHIEKELFMSTLSSIKEVIITYPLQEGDKYFLPSPYVAELPLIESLKNFILSEEELLLIKNKPIEQLLQDIKISKDVLILPEEISVTEIESYIKCPRIFFFEKLLKLEPPFLRLYKIDDRIFGKYAHKFMEDIFREKIQNFNEFKIKAEQSLEEILKNVRKPWKELLKEEFMNSFEKIWEIEKAFIEEGIIDSKVEFPVKGELSSFKLKGKIDRVIFTKNGCVLIDYKTGSQNLNCKQSMEGKDGIQLFLYAYLLSQNGLRTKKVGILSMKEFSVKWCPTIKTKGSAEQAIDAVKTTAEFALERLKKSDFDTNSVVSICTRCSDYLCPKFHNLEILRENS